MIPLLRYFSKIQEFNLHPEQELRFEVEKGCWLKLEVVGTDGNAELFGTELIKNKPYYFNDGQGRFVNALLLFNQLI